MAGTSSERTGEKGRLGSCGVSAMDWIGKYLGAVSWVGIEMRLG